MAILITGGTGFIGSHTVVECIENGMKCIIMDNLSNSKIGVLDNIYKITDKRVKFYNTDMLDAEGVNRIFKENDIDSVIHFAGLKAVGESVSKPLEYYNNNLAGTMNILWAMREHNCKKLVFSSSATVYGEGNTPPYTEDMPTSATNPYGYTKVMCERIMEDFCKAEDFGIVALRYFNPIGAHSSGLIGEDPNGIPNNLLPKIADVAAGKAEKLTVFGNDYDTPDGTGVRDYIHVADLAKGHIKAIEYLNNSADSGFITINLGTGTGYSVLEIIKAYEKASGLTIPYEIAQRRSGDIAVSLADVKKAKDLLGFEAEYGLDKMCEDAYNFVKTN
ncbi:MAG: UDP-glucose 4-epimerase GalE [Ruminococcus sp.]|jgi:UDP-glucose 4-epimerase|nr:UDP-glucose 4-epimerase GalE [Ruminococcus sp.]